jgi:hypothetical protein
LPGTFTPTGAVQVTPTIVEGPAQFPLSSFQSFVPDPGVTNDDTGAGTITVAGTATQSLSATDGRTVPLAVSGFVPSESAVFSDTIIFNDTSAVPLALAGTSTQSASHTASRTGSIATSGTRSESAVYTTVATGQTVLSGTKTEGWSTSTTANAVLTLGIVGLAYPGSLLPGATYAGQAYLFQSAAHTASRTGSVSVSGFGSDQYVQAGSQTFNDQATGTISLALLGVAYPGVFIVGLTYPGESYVGDNSIHTGSGTASFSLSGGGSEVVITNTRFGRAHPRRQRGYDNTLPSRNGFGQPHPRRVRVG